MDHNTDHLDDIVINSHDAAVKAGLFVKMGLHETALIIFKGRQDTVLSIQVIGKI